ncbi:MAG: hypothetical protein V8K32_09275 [Candidatus Electrothrix gigas]
MKRLILIATVCIFSFVLAHSSSFACTKNSDGTWKYCCLGDHPKDKDSSSD